MHEVAVVQDIVGKVIESIRSYQVEKVESVTLEVGELTMLSPEQMKFAYEVLTRDNLLKGSELIVSKREAVIRCGKCGYSGKPGYWDGSNHLSVPIISCPSCSELGVSLVEGRECVLKDIKVKVKD